MTAVVLDEGSAIRLDKGSSPPDFGIDITTLFKSVQNYQSDLNSLQAALNSKSIVYRVFTTDVSIPGGRNGAI